MASEQRRTREASQARSGAPSDHGGGFAAHLGNSLQRCIEGYTLAGRSRSAGGNRAKFFASVTSTLSPLLPRTARWLGLSFASVSRAQTARPDVLEFSCA